MKKIVSLVLALLMMLALLPVQVLAVGTGAAAQEEMDAQRVGGTYTVTFDTAGGSEIQPQVVSGTPAAKPEDPTREGYAFRGWYQGDTKYTFEEIVTENITLTAKWWPKEPPLVYISAHQKGAGFFVWNGFGKGSKNVYSNVPLTVTLGGFDFVTGEAPDMAWLLTREELTEDQMGGILFESYSGPITLSEEEDSGFLYAMYLDAFLRVWFVRTNRLIIDKTAPVVSGVTDGGIYCGARTVTVREENLDGIYVNGRPVAADANGQFTIYPAAERQTIAAHDKAGNVTALTVTVYDSARRSAQNGAAASGSANEVSGGITSAKTGDNSSIRLWSVTVCVSLAAAAAVGYRRRRG